MKKIFTCLFSIIAFLSFCYYCSNFYVYRGLEYDEKYIPLYIIVFLVIAMNFFICIFNSYKIEKQSKEIKEIKEQNEKISNQNEELKRLIIKLFDRLDENSDNILQSLLNSREISLDTYLDLQERDNND